MPANDYFSAAYPNTWQILGVRLKPLSLGHYFKLRRLGCAFVADEAKGATLGDLLLAIVVCSMASDSDAEHDPFWQWLNREPGFRLGVRNWLKSLFGKPPISAAEWDIYQWGQKCRGVSFAEKANLFSQYIKYHTEQPGYYETEQGGTQSGAHWSQGILHALTSRCGYTMMEAYNTSLRKCLADAYKLMESDGIVRLMTPEEIEVAS